MDIVYSVGYEAKGKRRERETERERERKEKGEEKRQQPPLPKDRGLPLQKGGSRGARLLKGPLCTLPAFNP